MMEVALVNDGPVGRPCPYTHYGECLLSFAVFEVTLELSVTPKEAPKKTLHVPSEAGSSAGQDPGTKR